MNEPIKILIVEDLPTDVELAQRELRKHFKDCKFVVVDKQEDFLEALESFDPDLVMSDYNLPTFDGLTALKLCLKYKPLTPFVMLTGSMNEDTAVDCMKAGAWDYVIKEHNKRLGASAISALEKKKSLAEKVAVTKANEENLLLIQQIAETVPLFLLIYDISTNTITYANRDIGLLLGYEYNEIKEFEKKALIDLLHPEDAKDYKDKQKRLTTLSVKETVECEYRVKNNNGDWTWFHSRYVVFTRDEQEHPKLILETVEDITTLKQSQAEIFETHQFYKQILSSTHDGIMVTNMKDEVVFLNPRMELIYVKNIRADAKVNILQLLQELGRGSELDDYNKAKKGEFRYSGDFTYKNITTEEIGWAKAQYLPLIDITDNISGVICIIHDITDLKQEEEELRESEHKYKTIFENIQEVYFETDFDGRIVEVSPSISHISGYARDEIIGTDILDAYANKSAREDLMTQLVLGKKVTDFEIELTDKDGSLVSCAVSAQILRDSKEQNPHIFGIMRDVSERKRITNELIEAKEQAEEMSRLKSAFLANMSHELRTPLVGILGFAELLLDMISDAEIQEMVETILESGERLHNTLNLILDLSRVEANRQEVKSEEIDFVSVIASNCNLYMPLAKKKKLAIDFVHEDDKLIYISDKHLLGNIISNVINNAIKYTESGFIKLTLSRDIQNSNILIKAQDTGIGLDESRFEIVFDAFRQASEGYSRSHEGTGLGLTITRKYVELLNGKITLQSKKNEGSTFTIALPYDTDIMEKLNG